MEHEQAGATASRTALRSSRRLQRRASLPPHERPCRSCRGEQKRTSSCSESVGGVNARELLNVGLKDDVAPVVRAAGFKGSGRNFSRKNDLGDVAFLNIQGSAYSESDHLVFYVNVAVVPYPWWRSRIDDWEKPPSKPDYSFGLYENRLYRQHGEWEITNADSARAVTRDLRVRINQHDGLPLLTSLLDREKMKARIRDGDLGLFNRDDNWDAYFDRALAILLADEGPGPELDQAMARLRNHVEQSDPYGGLERSLAWVRQWASQAPQKSEP